MRTTLVTGLTLLLLISLTACVMPEDTTVPRTSGSTIASSEVMKINGRPVFADELIKSPMLRQILRQYITFAVLKEETSRLGIVPGHEGIQEKVDEVKTMVEDGGSTWEDFLKEQSITDNELREQVTAQLLFEGLLDSMCEVTDDDIRAAWDDDKESIIDNYIRENHLPDSDRASTSFEDCKEPIEESLLQQQRYEKSQDVLDLLLIKAEVSLTSIADPTERKLYEDLIINNAKPEDAPELREEEPVIEAEGDVVLDDGDISEGEPAIEGTGTEEDEQLDSTDEVSEGAQDDTPDSSLEDGTSVEDEEEPATPDEPGSASEEPEVL